MPICRVCRVELTEENWYSRHRRDNNRICNECKIKEVRDWQRKNPERKAKNTTEWMRGYMRTYRKTHSNEIHEIVRVEKHRRKRDLPTNTILNEHFKGAHLHHLSPLVAVYIPEVLHRSVSHSLKTGRGMNEINTRAMEWLRNPYKPSNH